MTEDEYIRSEKARSVLRGTDFVVLRAMEQALMSPEWCAWRDALRRIAETGKGEIPGEPHRTRKGDTTTPASEPPEHLADLIDWAAPPKERQEALIAKLREINGHIGLAEDRGGRAPAELYRKRDRIESGIHYNRATSTETI